jgi:hypothetical protein
VIGTILALWLACPPTAEAAAAPKQPPWRITPKNAGLYDHLEDMRREPLEWANLEVAAVDPPELELLPLWDLLATVTALEAASDSADAKWLRWAIETAGGRPHEAYEALVSALMSDELSAARLSWWRDVAPPTIDSLEALQEAYEWANGVEQRMLLAAALALTHWELSCPVALAPDGACRMPDASVLMAGRALIRREPIAVERARDWTAIALKLRRKTKLDPEDLATAELLAELAIAAQSEEYERLLSARMPNDLSFIVEEWRHDSGVPRWERAYERQVARADESKARVEAFYGSYGRCWSPLYEVHGDAVRTSAKVATRALLREATLLFEAAEAVQAPLPRDFRHHGYYGETPGRCSGILDSLCDHATSVAQRCVTIGTMLAGEGEVVEACRAIVDAQDYDADRLRELVPEPRSTSVMRSPGVVGPEFL